MGSLTAPTVSVTDVSSSPSPAASWLDLEVATLTPCRTGWVLEANTTSRRSDLLHVTPPPPNTCGRGGRAAWDTERVCIDQATFPHIVARIISFADHETQIRCRLLSRALLELIDPMLSHSVVLSALKVENEPAIVLRSRNGGRLPGLPPRSYNPSHARRNVSCFHPGLLRYTQTLTLTNPFRSLDVSTLVPYLSKVHTVRHTFPGGKWLNPFPCNKYVTLTHLSSKGMVGVPVTPPGVVERVLNISCPSDSRAILYSRIGAFRLAASVRRVVVIIDLPPVVRPEAYLGLLEDGQGLGVLEYFAQLVVTRIGQIHFVVVGHDTIPPTALGFPYLKPMDRGQLEFDIYQRILAKAPQNDFPTFLRITKALKFYSLKEYRSSVGDDVYVVDKV